jgi:membrane-associated phospholipid phosphatase
MSCRKPDEQVYLALWDANTRFFLSHAELWPGLNFSLVGTKACLSIGGSEVLALQRPSRQNFKDALERVRSWAALRDERMPEILVQVAPQWAFWSAIANLHPERSRATIELGLCALQFAMIATQRIKHMLACPRPADYDPTLQPILQTPPYAAFPGGHAVEAVVAMRVLSSLASQTNVDGAGKDVVTEWREQFEALTSRIAENRVVAGLHFPVDSASGYLLGQTLAEYFLARCGQGTLVKHRKVDGTKFAPTSDFTDGGALTTPFLELDPRRDATVTKSDLMAELWRRAQEEWIAMGF